MVGETPAGQPPGRRHYIVSAELLSVFLSPFQGFVIARSPPTACAVGCILAPLRGLTT